MLIEFTDPATQLPCTFNAQQIAIIQAGGDDPPTTLLTVGSNQYVVEGAYADVSAAIDQALTPAAPSAT